ncbi:putative SnoaL-like aldol condensation-catalyzing enzyme [Inhella inkyongensis]|uniref:Putative SnoaL-like aldol condensation-catalyzing enzyme n=1 Tax=Inhella inkyongensis TaxID=392593 RepID=A0A840S3H1_9BURK|nr:nuclear transport factor 2 family protein [Inhella inkyongensis]MBB5204885.1 putative SnoaL-like aldol condensation-catalyzing enzyme [Inhella inkyongensis]
MRFVLLTALIVLVLCAPTANAQVPVRAEPDHERLLASADPKLAANKRLVYDFWREVFEAGQMARVSHYLTEGYIQHNPMVPTGRAGFVAAFGPHAKSQPVQARVQAPLVDIVAEGDRVVMVFVSERPDPKNPGQTYTTTWFDLFRIENGQLAEHWDPAAKR